MMLENKIEELVLQEIEAVPNIANLSRTHLKLVVHITEQAREAQ